MKEWLLKLRDTQSIQFDDDTDIQEIEETRHTGVSENARASFTAHRSNQQLYHWTDVGPCTDDPCPKDDITVQIYLDRYQVSIRPFGSKRANFDGTVKLIMLISAILTEPPCVWLRGRSFVGVEASREALQSCVVEGIDSLRFKSAMNQQCLIAAALLHEGVKVAAGAGVAGNVPFVDAFICILELIQERHEKYEEMMNSFTASTRDAGEKSLAILVSTTVSGCKLDRLRILQYQTTASTMTFGKRGYGLQTSLLVPPRSKTRPLHQETGRVPNLRLASRRSNRATHSPQALLLLHVYASILNV